MQRNTKQRQQIMTVLQQGQALSAKQIHEHVGDIDLATVYRNLNRMVAEGNAREIVIDKDQVLFELTGEHDHQHAICKKCGKVLHIEIDKAALLKKLGINIDDFEVEDIELNLKGHCKS